MKLTKAKWIRIKLKAPKVPDYTCGQIDEVINLLEKFVTTDKKFNISNYKIIVRKLERLRTANDKLRESGMYWYDTFKKLFVTKT